MAITLETVSRGFFIALFIGVGALHFVNPFRDNMAKMIPPFYPNPVAWVYFSGVLELLGGVGLLTQHYRQAAGFLLLLLVGVTQSHVYCQLNKVELYGDVPTDNAWAVRNTIQLVWGVLLYKLWRGTAAKSPAVEKSE